MRRALATLAVFAALAGCGLPVEQGVRVPDDPARDGQAGAAQGAAGSTVLLPPGWRAGATPVGVVDGFLRAHASAEDDHAIARRFLALEVRQDWDADAGVRVYDPQELEFEVLGDQEGDAVQVRLRGVVRDTIGADGTLDPQDVPLDETYSLRRDSQGNWVLIDVPAGLRLRPIDVDRSYANRLVYYLARGTGADGHLVPDTALLRVEEEPAEGLVRRLVAGPSAALVGAVDTAVPDGAPVEVTTDAGGRVTVDLGPDVARLPPASLERLSAQLVWTLRGAGPAFAELQLRSAGQPVDVPGVDGDVQERSAWAGYDPDGLREAVTTYYLTERRLLTLEGETVTAAAGLAVDRAAVSPRTDELAMLTDVGEGRVEVRIGPLGGAPPTRPEYTGGGLRSPSWGSGLRGLWLLQTGPGPQVLLLRPSGAAAPVPVEEPPPGRITALEVSRDGARVALVVGQDDASRKVYVAPVIDDSQGLRIGRPRPVGFDVTDVSDVAWESATSLVVLGEYQNPATLPLRLALDGSGAVAFVSLPGLEQVEPESIAAAPDRPLVVAAVRDGRSVLLSSGTGVFVEEPEPGYAPFYPG